MIIFPAYLFILVHPKLATGIKRKLEQRASIVGYLEEKVSVNKPSSISKAYQLHELGQLLEEKMRKLEH